MSGSIGNGSLSGHILYGRREIDRLMMSDANNACLRGLGSYF